MLAIFLGQLADDFGQIRQLCTEQTFRAADVEYEAVGAGRTSQVAERTPAAGGKGKTAGLGQCLGEFEFAGSMPGSDIEKSASSRV